MLKNRFTLLPVIVALAWPTILEQILQTAVQYIDTMMVGSLGTDATAAVGSTVTINWLVNGTVAAVGVGFLSYISQAVGAGEKERISAASAQAVFCTIVCGVFFTVLTLSISPLIPNIMMVDP
ncbi:MAG: MATE family efflux transporter, partial [Acutalibacteraceae bacterium]|nr:MATE family efflux transporter [Acutalibacteraceae bacterium]